MSDRLNILEICGKHYIFNLDSRPSKDKCPYCKIDRLTAELAETKDRAQMYADNIIITLNRAEKAESELSRYKSGVERQGFIDEDGSILVDYEVRDTLWKEFYNCQRVKVLVMKENENE